MSPNYSLVLRASLFTICLVSMPAYAGSVDNFALRNSDVGGAFTLTNQFGETTSLADLGGRVVVLTFGFTNCPDICPTTLVDLRTMLAALGDKADEVTVVFVTVDPARDTPPQLRQYLAHFSDAIIGLTGSEAEIAAVAARYDIRYAKQEPDDGGYYAVDHSSFVYLLDGEGRARHVIPYAPGSTLILEGVEALLAERG